jgi:hypothetical protein
VCGVSYLKMSLMEVRPSEQEFEEIVSRNRESAIATLGFEPNLAAALTLSDVKLLTSDLRAFSSGWERLKVVENLAARLPRERGIYMFVWLPPLQLTASGSDNMSELYWILYVGKAGVAGGTHDTFQDRYISEYRRYVSSKPDDLWCPEQGNVQPSREDRMKRFLALQPLEYWFLPVERVEKIENLERRLIRLLNPPLNRKGTGPRLRPTSRGPAF